MNLSLVRDPNISYREVVTMFAFNKSSPVVATASILVNGTPEDVFEFIGEQFFTNYPRWSPEVRELRAITSGRVKVGTRARQVRVDLGHRSESIFAVTIFEPAQRVCFEGISCPYRCDYEIRGMPSRTPSQISFTFELANLETYLRPVEGMIRRAIRDGVERTVHNLKQLVEADKTDACIGCISNRAV